MLKVELIILQNTFKLEYSGTDELPLECQQNIP